MTTGHFSTPEARAFYQKRVSSFGLIIAAAGAIGFLFRIVIVLSSGSLPQQANNPSYWLHLAALVPCVVIWLICRRGSLSLNTVIAVETVGILAAAIAYIGMGMTIPPEVGADVITAFALSFAFFARAVFVPSTARHTAILGAAVGIPLIAMMFRHYMDVDAEMWRRVGYDTRGFEQYGIATSSALMTTMWWTLTVGLSSLACNVIYGLRTEVKNIQRLGQYQLERKLGEGAMGVVYKATHGMLKRPTAVKLLRPELSGYDTLKRFRREVQLTAKLTHPHTVTIFDYGRTPDGLFYYAMEFLDGASLQQVVDATGPQPVSRVVRIMHNVALALDEAHTVGLIHRDIKPSNIMLAQQGGVYDVVKVLDFGLVKRMRNDGDPEQTDTHALQGTPHYMSPEAIEQPETVDARSDVYALGAVAYYLLAGRPVFEDGSFFEIVARHVQEMPKPLNEVCPTPIPRELEALILSCLAKAKSDRPESAKAFADALDQLDVPPWTRADAERWWSEYGSLVEQERESMTPRITGHTMDVAIDEPWFESSDGLSQGR